MMPALVVEMLSAVNQMKTEPKQEALTLIEAEREFGRWRAPSRLMSRRTEAETRRLLARCDYANHSRERASARQCGEAVRCNSIEWSGQFCVC